MSQQPVCTCYVARLPAEDRFCLRYGAHDVNCPVYRPSGDPVDREQDRRVREESRQLHGYYAIMESGEWLPVTGPDVVLPGMWCVTYVA